MHSTIYKRFSVAVCISLVLVNQSLSALAQSLPVSTSTGSPSAPLALSDASGVKLAPHEFKLGQIQGLCWEKPGESTAIVVCLHGLTLSANSYSSFGSALSGRGLIVFAPELSGITHRDDIYKFDQKLNLDKTVRDINWLVGELKRRYPYKPLFLFGESLGGAVAIRSAAHSQENLSGLICIAPSWKYNKEKTLVVRGVMAVLTGRNVVRSVTRTVIPMVTSDRQLQERLRNDAFLKKSYSLAETLLALRFLDRTGNAAKRVDVPALSITGVERSHGKCERNRRARPLYVITSERIRSSRWHGAFNRRRRKYR